MYNNPLFSINLPSNSVLSFSNLDSSDFEDNNMQITYINPICSIIKVKKKKKNDENVKKFNYFNKGKKVKKINI